ncbi:MAG: cellulose synthase family protein [Candidatus Latescibacterota bacterium]|nr:cellulose synthase family protein [Candidatus Latescibacterota bacterium]
MDALSTTQITILGVYCGIVAVLSLYGFHRWHNLRLYLCHRHDQQARARRFDELPGVTVQLPIFNEFHVVERLISTVGRLDYPRDRLQIQVLDDSTDETQGRARAAADRLQAKGIDIDYVHRDHRHGYKAGALDHGLKMAKHDLIFILDADFVPPADVLHRVIHHFTDAEIGMVQMRWGHINRHHSLLTRIQSIFLDGHLVIEHTARSRSGRFFNFNGTAGIWRRQAIDDAGGWEHDTLTEDLDLSFRSQLAGWRFRYLPDVEVPAELPVEINAFKSQQHRWTKGAVQTAKKILPRVWKAPLPLKVKVEATFHLTANSSHILILAMAILVLPVVSIRELIPWHQRFFIIDLPLFSMATMAVSGFYLASQRALYEDWSTSIKYLPVLMAIGISLCVNNARAVAEGLIGYQTGFHRTPKYGATGQTRAVGAKYAGAKTIVAAIELLMAGYFVLVIAKAWAIEMYAGIPFLMLFHAGFLYTGALSGLQPFFTKHWLRPARAIPA